MQTTKPNPKALQALHLRLAWFMQQKKAKRAQVHRPAAAKR